MLKLIGLTLIFILNYSCVKQQGGFSKPLVFGSQATGAPGEKVFFAEEANILQFLQNLENTTPSNAESGELDPFISRCGSFDTPLEFRDFASGLITNIFQVKGQNYDTYQTLFFTGANPGNLANKKIDLDLNKLEFVGAFNYDYSPLPSDLTFAPPGTRIAIAVPFKVIGQPISIEFFTMHLLKVNGNFSNGGFVWAGDGVRKCDDVVVIPDLPDPPTSISLKAPLNQIDIETNPTLVISGVELDDIVKVYSDSKCVFEVTSTISSSNSVDVNIPSLSSGTYTFYSRRFLIDNSVSACSTAFATYTLDLIPPPAPFSLSMVNPALNTGNISTPTLRVSGVNIDDTIRVFADSNCQTPVGQGIAEGNSIDIVLNSLDPGSYTLWANASDPLLNIGPCSNANVSYFLDLTPPPTPNLTNASVTGDQATITVENVSPGDTVKLYSTAGCSNLVGSASSVATEVDVTTVSLINGSYTVYGKSIDLAGNESSCTSVGIDFVISN